jgi:hypothetical protein
VCALRRLWNALKSKLKSMRVASGHARSERGAT